MKAIILKKFGGPEVLELAEMPKPSPGPNQVLIKIAYAAVNPVDFKIRSYPSNWAGIPIPGILGYDASGVVEAIGVGVQHLKVGDEVFYSAKIHGRQGTYAEYHVEDADIVAKKPSNLSFEEAASLPLAGCTAWDAIVTQLQVRPGQTILVHAGAGGVGSLAIQIARAAGARVYTTCRPDNQALVKSLGAYDFIDYRKEKFEEVAIGLNGGQLFDGVFDTVGGDTVARSIGMVKPYGRIATCVGVEGDLNGMLSRNQSLHFGFMERTGAKMVALRVLAERGELKALIDSVYPLEKTADAHRKIEAGGVRGKILIQLAK